MEVKVNSSYFDKNKIEKVVNLKELDSNIVLVLIISTTINLI